MDTSPETALLPSNKEKKEEKEDIKEEVREEITTTVTETHPNATTASNTVIWPETATNSKPKKNATVATRPATSPEIVPTATERTTQNVINATKLVTSPKTAKVTLHLI